jgi:lipid-binding SYLF domain-containing protein
MNRTTVLPTINYGTIQWNYPVTLRLSSTIRQATITVQTMAQQLQQQQQSNNTTTTIPIDLLHIATGIVFLTVAKIGMIESGRVGSGVFIAKLPTISTTTYPKHKEQHHPKDTATASFHH